jgi:sulfate/thiosulfate transport system ATP-binding protein
MSIRVEGITKQFGAFTALNDVTLDFPNGELVALLGPSGCGKTTLLRIIAGLETAERGRILFDGADASDRHVRERQVGFVFQHYALFRHMSIFENVAFGLRVRPRAQRPTEIEIRGKVMELLDLVQLAWLADRAPAQLSGGQRQRIALARALAVEPRVLLLDEPFGALDAKVRKELRRWLRQLHDDLHITSIFVTHDQEEALELADRVVLMNKGRVEQMGSSKDVYDHPASEFVFGFLGSANHVAGEVANGRLAVPGTSIALPVPAAEASHVTAYIRPHELGIERGPGDGIPATVRRVLELGALARVELTTEAGQGYEAEIPKSELAGLGLATGEAVRLVPRALRLFPRSAA